MSTKKHVYLFICIHRSRWMLKSSYLTQNRKSCSKSPGRFQSYKTFYSSQLIIKLACLSLSIFFKARQTQGTITEGYGTVQLTSLYLLARLAVFDIESMIYMFVKQTTITRSSTVLSLPLQLVFPGQA